jgi:steroid 5-alpha reductase family enzyme
LPLPAFIQNAILFVISLPTAIAVAQPHTPLSISDYILAATAVGTLIAEFTADNQQFAYQTFKHTGKRDPSVEWPGARIEWTEEDKRRGFITRGLWAESRHPNFLREQFFWVRASVLKRVA